MKLPVSEEQTLLNAGIRPTAVRILVWREISSKLKDAFATTDVERLLPTVDRSTLFRCLNSFTKARLLHEVDDGTGERKYCVCHCEDHSRHRGHVHLTCTQCRRTFCLRDVEIPPVVLPAGFMVEQTEYVVKGLCNSCQGKS